MKYYHMAMLNYVDFYHLDKVIIFVACRKYFLTNQCNSDWTTDFFCGSEVYKINCNIIDLHFVVLNHEVIKFRHKNVECIFLFENTH